MTTEIQMNTKIHDDPNHEVQIPTKIHGVTLGNWVAKNSNQGQLSTEKNVHSLAKRQRN